MQTNRLSHQLTRLQRLRQMIDKARKHPAASQIDVLRIQAVLLKAQQRLVEALVPQALEPVPIRVRSRSRHH